MGSQHGSDISDRLTSLEEAGAFSQRALDQLNDEVIELNRRMADVLTRLGRLEGRIGHLTATSPGTAREADPAALRPDGGYGPIGEVQD
jgi:uncharacterized coiled-coil protein SlyX